MESIFQTHSGACLKNTLCQISSAICTITRKVSSGLFADQALLPGNSMIMCFVSGQDIPQSLEYTHGTYFSDTL